ncbi:MAG: hypothetical protein JJ971_01030 [Balneolaceae bacterium]|nr:hypothetical protein [Balneolaceae bacterium]MBO6544954.1 hypothetical protein [Balneolaceae bacterium]MBO6646350.1 hypothetical protein [Balneolaceae bacterium]
MKRISWEIILAGLFFIAIALYLIGKPSGADNSGTTTAENVPEEPTPPTPNQVHVIDLENLEELAALEELQEIENLSDLGKEENLRKLKAIAHLIPAEARDEVLTEIDNIIRELSDENIHLNFEMDDKLLVINREYDNAIQGEWENTSPGVYTFLNEFDASSITSTSVKIPSGSITIVGTKDKTAKFTVQASGQISSKEDLTSKLNTISIIDDGEARFLLENVNKNDWNNIHLQTTLYIPENMELVTNTGGGHIEATNINGDQIYETGGGHININKVTGDILAVSGGGHVKVEDANGDVTLKSQGGHLVLKNCTGDAALDTKGGNIDAKEIDGEVIASTQGGNILLIYKKPITNDATLETSAGNIQIWMPKTSNATVELQGSNAVELQGFSIEGTRTKTKVSGKINRGGPEIIGFSKYGKVTLAGNDN